MNTSKVLSMQALEERLVTAKQITIRTQSGDVAIGEVQVVKEQPGVYTFTERGTWVTGRQENICFHNALRWSFVYAQEIIRLEHLRHGADHPIFLSSFTPTSAEHFQSVDPHLCREDCYFGHIAFNKREIHLTWRVLSARKNEILHYVYV